MVQKLSVEWWKLHSLNKSRVGDTAEANGNFLSFKMAAGDSNDLAIVNDAAVQRV